MAYQDITFVAGEVLTATKMNQIQSNISFIKSGVEDGTLIGEEVVKSSNIEWPTIGSDYEWSTTSTGKVSNNNYATAASLDLTKSGKYLLIASSRAEFYGGTYQNFYMRIIDEDGNVLSPTTGFYGGSQGGTLGQFTIMAMGMTEIINSSKTVRSEVTATGNNGGFANNSSLAAIRIG